VARGLEAITSPVPDCEDTGKPVWCLECKRWTTPDGRWKCTLCGVCCYYGAGPGTCPDCDGRTFGLREGHRWKILCQCKWTEEQRNAYAQGMAKRRQAEAVEAAKREEREHEAAKREVWTQAATDCWDGKQHNCNIPWSKPVFDWCHSCPRFGKPRYQPKVSTPTRDADWGGGLFGNVPMQELPYDEIDDVI